MGKEINIEEIKELYFDADALITTPEPIYRLSSGSDRFYYKFEGDGEPVFFTSVTTLIKHTMPTSPHLIKWIAEKGYEESKEYAAERAAYGTFLHIQIGDLLINRNYDLDELKEKLKAYIESEKLPANFISWEIDLKKDMLAFAQFMIDYSIKPLAIEVMLSSSKGFAGAIDLVCEMTIKQEDYWGEVYKSGPKKGEPKLTKKDVRIKAIIDFKSGRKGFYEEHEIQLHACKEMWHDNFREHAIDKVFNWSPKDYRGETPTYNLKDQTDSVNAPKLQYLIKIASIEALKRTNNIITPVGVIDIEKGLEKNIYSLSLAEIVKNKYNEGKDKKKQP